MILDTNALSAVADGQAPADWAESELSLPVIVLGEYRYGIGCSRRRTFYEDWLGEFMAVSRILPVEAQTARAYAELRARLAAGGQAVPANDLWIAALAQQHHLPILSRDHHFDLIPGIQRLGW